MVANSAITLSAVIVALSGAALGLIFAMVSIVAQYRTMNYYGSKESLTRETRNLEAWLNSNEFKKSQGYIELERAFDTYNYECKMAIIRGHTEAEFTEWFEANKAVWKAIDDFREAEKAKAELTHEKSAPPGGESGNSPNADISAGKYTGSLMAQVDSTMAAIFESVARLKLANAVTFISKGLLVAAYCFTAVMAGGLVLIITYGIQSAGNDLISKSGNIFWSINLTLSFVSQLVGLLALVGMYLEMIALPRRKMQAHK